MIKIQKLHYEVRRQLQRVHSDFKSHIDVADIDGYLNQSKEILLENYNAIVERNTTISNRLKSLEIKNYKLVKGDTDNRSTYFRYPTDHYSTLSRHGLSKSKTCSTIVPIFIHQIQTHKIEESLRDPKWAPNFNWRETFSNEDSKGINIYHGDILDIQDIFIDYIKWIPDVANVSDAHGTYVTADGETPQGDKHFMVDDPIVWRKVADIAVYLIKRDFDDNYKENIDTILFNEKTQIN